MEFTGAVDTAGNQGDVLYPGTKTGYYDHTYQDYDGAKSIRVLQPCTGNASSFGPNCQWFDNATQLAMVKKRWYSTAEALGDGTVAIIGGFVNGGYINRNYPNTDPDGPGAAENSYEFFPSPDGVATAMPFMRKTSGLNSYPHAFLMPSGKMFLQANYSTSECGSMG
jgi:hypothetical protein